MKSRLIRLLVVLILCLSALENNSSYTIDNTKYTRADLAVMLVDVLELEYASDMAVSFTDVSPSDPYYEAIAVLCHYGIVNGTGQGAFAPKALMTRAELATILCRMLGLEEVHTGTFPPDGLTTIGSFSFDELVDQATVKVWLSRLLTRAQMAILLYDKFQPEPVDAPHDFCFTDLQECTAEQVLAINSLTAAGILNGVNEDNYQPNRVALRVEIAALVDRTGGVLEHPPVQTLFSDIDPTAWYGSEREGTIDSMVKKGANTVDVSGLESGNTKVFFLNDDNFVPLFDFVNFP